MVHNLLASSLSSDSLAKRRNFSSPRVLDLDKIILLEAKIIKKLTEMKTFSSMSIKNREEFLLYKMREFDDELSSIRIEMNIKCMNMLLQLKKLVKIKIFLNYSGQIDFKQISNEMIRLLKINNSFFQNICLNMQNFEKSYVTILEFDSKSVYFVDLFHQIVARCHSYAQKHNFSTNNIPSRVQTKY